MWYIKRQAGWDDTVAAEFFIELKQIHPKTEGRSNSKTCCGQKTWQGPDYTSFARSGSSQKCGKIRLKGQGNEQMWIRNGELLICRLLQLGSQWKEIPDKVLSSFWYFTFTFLLSLSVSFIRRWMITSCKATPIISETPAKELWCEKQELIKTVYLFCKHEKKRSF